MVSDFIKQVATRLNTIDADIYFKKTTKADNYVVFDVDVFNKSYARVDGQLVIDVRYSDIMQLLSVQDAIIGVLDGWHYSGLETSASVYFSILNDLSSITDEQHYNELRFEYQLRWEE